MTTPSVVKPAQTRTQPAAWDLDPAHSVAEFSVRHLMISTVKGRFAIRRATVQERADGEPAIEAEVDVASVDTGAADRDAHLRSPDFFDAAGHPVMTFRSTRVEPREDDAWRVEGDLTIRGVTRPVALDVQKEGEARDPWGKQRVGLTATTSFDRRDYGLTWNQALETGGVLVGDKVKVTLHVQLVRRD